MIGTDDQAALRCFNDDIGLHTGAQDELGWADVQGSLWTAGAIAGAALAAGTIITAIAAGLKQSKRSKKRYDGR